MRRLFSASVTGCFPATFHYRKRRKKMKHDHCKWTATTTHGVDTVQLTVKGICQEPTPGYKLSLQRVDLKGGAPNTLYLVLLVTAPTGIEPDVITPTPVEYKQTFVLPGQHVPKEVIILADEARIPVQPAP
jgi:hypothetical protein